MPRKEADGSYHFFMLDASDDPFNVPGTVYLFGKVRLPPYCVSCGWLLTVLTFRD